MLLLILYAFILILYGTIVIIIPLIGFAGIFQRKSDQRESNLTISIIVPFRNNQEQLKELCRSINRLKHPKACFEVIFVDDHSSDQTDEFLSDLGPSIDCRLIRNTDHLGKKRSLLKGIEEAKYEWIFTTDADCSLPKKLFYDWNPEGDLSLGSAIKITDSWRAIENIQEVESLLLAGITIGSAKMEIPMLASGANLIYRKSLMNELSPYEDNLDVNSGDDMFLLKSALVGDQSIDGRTEQAVWTHCEKSWDAYIDQAARWAGKNDRVGLLQTNIAAWLVLAANLILPISLITHFSFGWIMLLIKFVLDFLFLFLTAVHFGRFKAILFAPIVFWFYPIHLVRVAVKIRNNKKNA